MIKLLRITFYLPARRLSVCYGSPMHVLGRLTGVVSVVVMVLAVPTVAAGAVRTGSITLNPNPTEPQFGSQPAKSLIPVVVSYGEQEGTITISEGGSEQSPFDSTEDTLQVAAKWEDIGFVWIDHCAKTIGPTSPQVRIGWGVPTVSYSPTGALDEPFGQGLLEEGVGGELTSHVTISADRSTWTSAWSSPILVGQNFTCFTLHEERSGEAGPAVIFAGYATPEPQPQTPVPSPAAPAPHVTAHRATKAQVRALEAVASLHHSGGFNRHKHHFLTGRVTSNGWAAASWSIFPHNAQPEAIVFDFAHDAWRVVTWGSSVCGAGSRVPKAVCVVLGL
jgi:hypothetical protein